MEVRTFLNHRIVPPPRVGPRLFSPVQPGVFHLYTYMLLNIHSAKIGIRSHGIRYTIYVNRVFRYPKEGHGI